MDNRLRKITDLSFGTLFGVTFVCGYLCWVFVGLLAVLISVVAPDALTINGQAASGFKDGIKAFFLCLILGGVFSILGAAIGAWLAGLVGKIRPFGRVIFKTDETV